MKTSSTSALLPCTPETFWTAFLDESYLSALYLEEPQYPAFAAIEIGEASRKLRIVPKMRLPAPESSIEREVRSARAKECAFLTRWVDKGGS